MALNPSALEYLQRRGINGTTVTKYGVGYAPGDWRSLRAAFPNYYVPALVDCGLVQCLGKGQRSDRFRDRIMFPIRNKGGAICGFGGRAITDSALKYLNSPESELFRKGELLFGLPEASLAMYDLGQLIVTEGFFDVLRLAQHGVENVVATLGTSVTARHAEALLSYGNEIVFCFDGDTAGKQAAARGLDACFDLIGDHANVSIVTLPDGQDPDSYIQTSGVEAFVALLAQRTSADLYLLSSLLDQVGDIAIPEERSKFAMLVRPWLQRTTCERRRRRLIECVAMTLDLDIETMSEIFDQ